MLIDDFGVADMFGRKNIQYFADVTQTGIRVKEKYRYEYHYPPEDSGQCKSHMTHVDINSFVCTVLPVKFCYYRGYHRH